MPHPTITHTVDVYRFSRTGNRDAYGASPIVQGLDVSIVPAGPETAAIYGGMNGFALFEIYMSEDVSLKNGDKLSDGTHSWIVRDQPQKTDNRYWSFTRVVGQEAL